MKRFKQCTITCLTALIISSATTPPAMASSTPVVASTAMAQLRMEDKGPDLSKGFLISESWGTEEDGTPYVERTYMDYGTALFSASNVRTLNNTKSYGATGSVEVSANFKFDSTEKTVYVVSSSGKFNRGGGISETEDLGTTTSGEGTSKATAKYSCRVNRNLGGWATYSVSISCNYNGTPS